MSKDIECPYCDAELDICHDDGFGYDEDTLHEMECDECGKNFVFSTMVSFNYFPQKADCLNGSSHNFREWRKGWAETDGTVAEIRYCNSCGKREKRIVKKDD